MNLSALKQLTETAEGRVSHFYLDTAGNVTIGVGHLVAGLASAIRLRLEPASEIAADFNRVRLAKPGMPAEAYRSLCVTTIAEQDIEIILESDIQDFLKGLRARFPEFDAWPDGPQEATFDVAYNLGLHGFPRLAAVLDAKDWRACAANCHRKPPISEARNERTAALYLSAV